MRLTILAFSALALAGAVGAAAPALACSCMAMSEEEHFEKSDLVFEGTVLKTRAASDDPDDHWQKLITQFRVTRTLKGDEAETREINHTRNTGANCGINFEDDKDYKVYAFQSDGGFMTNSCSYTQRIGHKAAAE